MNNQLTFAFELDELASQGYQAFETQVAINALAWKKGIV